MEKIITIPFDYSSIPNLLSYGEVLENMEKGIPLIHTTCLDFFTFSTLNKGYDVKVIKLNGDYVLLSELLTANDYTKRNVTKHHNVHKMLLANEFSFKASEKENDKKIRLSLLLNWEYAPIVENYDEGMTIEEMAEYDATHPDIEPLIRENGTYGEVVWKVVSTES